MRYDGNLKSVEDNINRLGLDERSVYLAISYFPEADIRQIKYYIVPWNIKDKFRTEKGITIQFRKEQMDAIEDIQKIWPQHERYLRFKTYSWSGENTDRATVMSFPLNSVTRNDVKYPQ